jgi:hypothetical protein
MNNISLNFIKRLFCCNLKGCFFEFERKKVERGTSRIPVNAGIYQMLFVCDLH